ncbi:MAG: flavin reductase family protein [Desulfotomaculales bacterium]
MRKVEVKPQQAYRMLNPGFVVLLSSAHAGRQNVMTAAWHMPVSFKPPLVAVSVAPTRFSAGLIQASGVFAVNIPGCNLLPAVQYCGTVSGRDCDKFARAGLTPVPAKTIGAPLVAECLGHIECRVAATYEAGDHLVFVGEVVAASAAEGLFDGTWCLGGAQETLPVSHLGGTSYLLPGRLVNMTSCKDPTGETRFRCDKNC